ncbi:hypothetical protein GmHk_10G028955 [Glycine max]|nr:hypothetical protein GmHk_10G028955 [Glycine max]
MSNNLKVVHSGTKEFKIASNKRDLFLGFSEHQERLRKKLTLEEGRIFVGVKKTMSITEKVTRQVMASFIQLQSQMQSQGLAVPLEPLVDPSGPRVSTKGSCVDPSGNDPQTGDSDRCGLYIEIDHVRLVAMGRVYEGSTIVHNTPLLPGQVKVSVEEVTDADALVPVPTDEVSLVGQAFHTFLAWPTHLVKSLSQQILIFLTIYTHFRFHCSRHWQMVVILPKEHLVVWFCSLYNRPDNYLKGIINSAIKGLDDAPQPKSKASARWIVVKYFNDPRPLKPERLKALQIQWAQFFLRVRDQA